MDLLKRYFVRHRNLWSSEFKNPKALYESACESVTRLAYVCGAERCNPEYRRINPRLILMLIDFILYLVLSFWCVTVLWGQLNDVIFCFVTMGGAVQAFAKTNYCTTVQYYRLHLKNLANFENFRDYEEVEDVMWNVAAICKLSVKFCKILYNALLFLVVAYSIIGSLFSEHYVLVFGYFFPWIDPDTFVGYLINFTYQSTFLLYTYCGLQTSDLGFLFFIMHAYGQLETIGIYLRKLEQVLKSGLPSNVTKMNELLNDVIDKHTEHTIFLSELNQLLQTGIFLNIKSLVAQTVFACFVLATIDEIWYTGLAIVVLSAIQIFGACFLGSLLSAKNDQLIREIYDISWNNLPIDAQKKLQLLLHSAQQPMVLSDGFNAVDLYYFVAIYNQIYSFVAMLLSFN